jgi:hypothetical protein
MDKAEPQFPIALTQQTMLAVQHAAKTGYPVDEVLATFAIMMKMDLHIGYSFTNHFRQRFQQRRMIFFFWKEKGISRCVASRVGLTTPRNRRPCRPPQSDARLRGVQIGVPPPRFVMVRDGHPYALEWWRGTLRNLPQTLFEVTGAPNLRIVD